MLTAFIAGVLLGLPVLRMRGDYLAIATLGFGEIIRILALSDSLKPFMGGAQGITRIDSPQIGDWVFDSPERIYYLVLIGCVIAWFVAARLKTSRLGRAWMAIREDEDVAQAMGVNRVTAKLLAFAIGALLGGMSGAIFASFVGSVVPLSFGLLVSINVLALIIVGGMGSLPGVLVGALVLVGLPELLREFSEYRLLVYGAVLVVMMLFRPEGLWPEATRRRELHKETVPLPETTEPVTTATSVSTSTSSVKD
jgi:branched-chain amino acid transport system permease protein